MRHVEAKKIREAVKSLALKANFSLRKDVLDALKKASALEKKPSAKKVLKILIDNAKIARSEKIAICQDTGMAEVFYVSGQDVHVRGDINKAITEGIKLAYAEGFLRKSVVSDPILRKNTNTNTPPVIHYEIVKGDKIRLTVLPKGFGCENASTLKMLNPMDSEDDIIDYIVEAVKLSGADACPPLVVGIGIGGTLDKAAFLAMKAILKPLGKKNPKKHFARMEKAILTRLNNTGIGPGGLGGMTTCLGVNILSFPTHIAGLPVCVKISCHATRSASCVV
jgi:fumarate hydratase subunit alpha